MVTDSEKSEQIPDIFKGGVSRAYWRIRCRGRNWVVYWELKFEMPIRNPYEREKPILEREKSHRYRDGI